jgi:hypothetical protein
MPEVTISIIIKVPEGAVVEVDAAPEQVMPSAEYVEVGPEKINLDEQPKRHRRTKAEMEAARAAETSPTVPTSAPDTASTEEAPPNAATPSAPTTDITDKELTEACNAAMGRIGDANKIRALIGEYTTGGVATIEQSDRAKFLDRLSRL